MQQAGGAWTWLCWLLSDCAVVPLPFERLLLYEQWLEYIQQIVSVALTSACLIRDQARRSEALLCHVLEAGGHRGAPALCRPLS